MLNQKSLALFVVLLTVGFFSGEREARAITRLSPTAAPAGHSYVDQGDSLATTSGSRNLGLGVMFGEPTGLTMKYWTSHANALQFGLTYSFGNYFAVLCDYLWHFPNVFKKTGVAIVPYAGIGALLGFTSDGQDHPFFGGTQRSSAGFGARIPLGLELTPPHTPLGIFAEIVPGIGLLPGIDGFVQGDLGLRIYL